MPERLEFNCPRCAAQVAERFYGPCDACRSELRASQWRAAQAVTVAAYEPKMNVVPNQVALKEE